MKIKCKVCKKKKGIFYAGMCIKCYNATYYKECLKCGVKKRVNGNGFCDVCRTKIANKMKMMKPVCKKCGFVKEINDNGLCEDCVKKNEMQLKMLSIEMNSKVKNIAEQSCHDNCLMCGEYKYISAKEMCYSCYQKFYRKIVFCLECNERKVLKAKGLCSKCYDKERKQKR